MLGGSPRRESRKLPDFEGVRALAAQAQKDGAIRVLPLNARLERKVFVMENGKKRETLGSRLGFIFLSAGCAIGLGNVWRFPFITG